MAPTSVTPFHTPSGVSMSSDETSVPLGYARDIFDLTGRVSVITGGGSGLGRAIAIGYAQCGVTVVVADINEEGATETKAVIDEQGGTAVAVPLDVTKRSQCVEVAGAVRREHGRIDILVNSAGAAHRSPAEEFPEERFDHIIDLNLKGTYLCCQAFGTVMLEQGKGSIINMASIGSFIAYPLSSAYIASKGGVAQVTKVLALEWRERGVRVNGIGPTLMESPMTQKAAQTTSLTADFIKARMLRPRVGLPRDLIGAAIFLASDASELVTGHTIMCDDGYLAA
ncbi:MAG: SDR family oxidoreductase [Rhodospirillales bacterium]|nr:SDR family oxidoreductase [Rhodospirillales bacterium]